MTTQRVLILVAVLLAALTAVSIALGRSQRKDVDPGTSRFQSFLPRRQTNDFHSFTVSAGRWDPASGLWTLDAKVLVASMQIGRKEGGWNRVRNLKLSLSGADPVELKFNPKRQSGPESRFLDEGVADLKVPKLQPGKTLNLTILENGGQLEVRRLGSKGTTVLKVQ